MKKYNIMIFDMNGWAYRYWNKGLSDFYVDMLIDTTRLIRKFEPVDVVFCFDSYGSKWRKDLYPEYKENRNEKKDKNEAVYQNIYKQLDKAYNYLEKAGEKVLRFEGIEADDLIAFITLYDNNTVIISEDYDLLQLPSILYSPKKKVFITLEVMYDCTPSQFILAKAMAGDTGDNIKGIHRVGITTALKYIKRLGAQVQDYTPIELLKLLENYLETKKELSILENRILENLSLIKANLKLVDLITYNNQILKENKEEIIEILERY